MHVRSFQLVLLILCIFSFELVFGQTSDTNASARKLGQTVRDGSASGGDAYKIVVASSKSGSRTWIGNDQIKKELWAQQRELRDKVNGITTSGYRLKGLILPMALVAKDRDAYEYDFLDADSAGMNLPGFRLFIHLHLFTDCNYYGTGTSDSDQQLYCTDITVDAYERALNASGKVEQFIVDRMAAPNTHPAHFMAAEINQKFREGFYPAKIISKYGIVLEKGPEPEFARYNPEFEVLREGSKLEKKVNVLAKQGYRVLMTESGIAVLYRNDKTRGISVSYRWIDGLKPDLGEKIAKLEQAGALYCAVSSNEKGIRKFLIFEQPSQLPARPSEFRIIDFDIEHRTDPTDGQDYLDLTEDSKRGVTEMNKLSNEGFAVRDLFQNGRIAMLLERTP